MNIVSYSMVESLRGPTGTYTVEDAENARVFQTMQYVSLGVFGALLVWGIVDAVVKYESSTVRGMRTLDRLPDEYKDVINPPQGSRNMVLGIGFFQVTF